MASIVYYQIVLSDKREVLEMAELTPVQQAAERALLVLLRKHMVHTYEVARRLTAKEIDERLLDLRRLKSAHPKGGSYFTATVNAMIRELLRLKI